MYHEQAEQHACQPVCLHNGNSVYNLTEQTHIGALIKASIEHELGP